MGYIRYDSHDFKVRGKRYFAERRGDGEVILYEEDHRGIFVEAGPEFKSFEDAEFWAEEQAKEQA